MAEEEKDNAQQNLADDPKKGLEQEVSSEKQGEAGEPRFGINADNLRDAAIGDGASINNYNGLTAEDIKKLQGADREWVIEAFDHIWQRVSSSGNAGSVREKSKLFASLRYEREQVVAENEATSAASSIDDAVELPKTLQDLEQWYDTLDDYEQCFVQAASVLHGAPILEVSNAAGKLYQPLQVASISREETVSQSSSSPSSATRRSLRRELLKHTRVTARRVNHVDRTFWRSTDVLEQQTFTLRMLRFFADEFAISYGEPRFSDTLKKWAESMSGECSRKAARGLGIVLYHQSADELWRTTNAWANSSDPGIWRLAASSMNGAYDVHKLDDEKGANDTQKSPIFRLLNQWVERAQNARNPRVGCAAANTYGLISQKAPDVALSGLESLLCFPESSASNDWESISVSVWVESVSNYVGLAWSGHIRKVLDHLACTAEKLIYQRQRPNQTSEREQYRRRSRLNLEAIFDIFFPTALSSLIGIRDDIPVSYSLTEPLPEQPQVPDEQGKDVLLAAILSEAERHWSNCIATLLCTATFAGKAKEASFFMRQWAEVVLKDSSTDKEQLETVYMEFVVHVGCMLKQWNSDLTAMRFGPPPAFRIFTHNLSLWLDKRRTQPTDAFIQKVLQELDNQ